MLLNLWFSPANLTFITGGERENYFFSPIVWQLMMRPIETTESFQRLKMDPGKLAKGMNSSQSQLSQISLCSAQLRKTKTKTKNI